jgi:hypothetical protein
MNCYLVNTETIDAYWAHGLLFLRATGHAECAGNVSISESPLRIYPPEFQVMTCPCLEIGSFPYDVHAWFHLGEQPETVTVNTASGPQKVEVQGFPSDISDEIATPSALTDKLADGEVVGVSPNSWDVNRAITDAVNQLQKAYPGRLNATVTETGVVAVGSPIGIAFLYVRMLQAAGSRKAKASKKKSSSD